MNSQTPVENKGSERGKHARVSATDAQRHPSQGVPGKMGTESHGGMAWKPGLPKKPKSSLVQQKGQSWPQWPGWGWGTGPTPTGLSCLFSPFHIPPSVPRNAGLW